MSEESLINSITVEGIVRSFNKLGIEGTLETAETLHPSRFRDKLVEAVWKVIRKEV